MLPDQWRPRQVRIRGSAARKRQLVRHLAHHCGLGVSPVDRPSGLSAAAGKEPSATCEWLCFGCLVVLRDTVRTAAAASGWCTTKSVCWLAPGRSAAADPARLAIPFHQTRRMGRANTAGRYPAPHQSCRESLGQHTLSSIFRQTCTAVHPIEHAATSWPCRPGCHRRLSNPVAMTLGWSLAGTLWLLLAGLILLLMLRLN